jgi:hypothetical protein
MHDGNISKVAEVTRRANMNERPLKLRVGTRMTKAFYKLCDGLQPEGARIVRRARGYSDYDVVAALVRQKLMEIRYVGPRGGARYFTTSAGLFEIDNAHRK